MDKLKAINTVLRYLGEYPVQDVDVMYPTVDMIKPALEEQRKSLLTQGWWFNTYYKRVLQPDDIGQVQVPEEALVVVPETDEFIWNGRYIAKADGTAPDGPVTVDLVVDIPFDDLPQVAQYAVVYAAAYSTYSADFGIDNTSESLQQQAGAYFQSLTAQHTRTRKYSTRDKPSYRRYIGALRR